MSGPASNLNSPCHELTRTTGKSCDAGPSYPPGSAAVSRLTRRSQPSVQPCGRCSLHERGRPSCGATPAAPYDGFPNARCSNRPPRNSCRSPGPDSHINLHKGLPPRADSKAKRWRAKHPAGLPSGSPPTLPCSSKYDRTQECRRNSAVMPPSWFQFAAAGAATSAAAETAQRP